MIIPMSIVFLIKFVSANSPEIQKHSLNCFYLRYMYNVFRANSEFSLEPNRFGSYANEFQSNYSEIILAILDELREKEPSIDVYALININLYLNNVFGTLMVRWYEVQPLLKDETRDVDYKKEFYNVHYKLLTDLSRGIDNNCFIRRDGIFPKVWLADNLLPDPKYKDLNDLLPKELLFWDKMDVALNYLKNSTLALKNILHPIMQRGTYWSLHPKKMIFYDMLSTNEPKSNNTSSGELDSMDVLREITLETSFNNEEPAKIGKVFEKIQLYCSAKYVRAFQQQVLAATVHPLMHLVGTYLMFFKRVYYLDINHYETIVARVNMFKSVIENMGASILNIFDKFIRLELLPKKIQIHLTITFMELRSLVDFTDKLLLRVDKPRWIEFLYYRCSQPMKHNKLRFGTDVESWQMDQNNTEYMMAYIDRVDKYIKDLSNYKSHYDIVVNKILFYSHDDIFENFPDCYVM